MTGEGRAEREKSWGVRFYERRQALRLSQEQVAKLADVTQQAVSKFESDPNYVPRWGTLERYARALGTTVDELFPMVARPRRNGEHDPKRRS